MLICCPNEVRKMYGLPACVISAASAPVICGTSACWARIMLTFTEPEKTGPKSTYGSPSSAFCTWARETPGLLCVSDWGATILRPRIPPLALISSIASTAPSRKLVPDTAPAPDSSMTIGIFTFCCAWAAPAPRQRAAARAATRMLISPPPLGMLAGASPGSQAAQAYLSLTGLGADVGRDDVPQLGRHFRACAEPLLEAEPRLLQQHTEAVHRAVATASRGGEQRRLERDVHDVVDHDTRLQRADVDLERRLADHPERRAVDEQIGVAEQRRKVVVAVRAHPPAEALGEPASARDRAIDDPHLQTARRERIDGGTGGAARAQDHGASPRHGPARRAVIEMGHEAVGVGVPAHQPAILQPQGIHGSDRLGRFVAAGHQLIRGFLVGHRHIPADIAVRPKLAHEGRKFLGRQVFQLVDPADPERAQPVAVDHRGARMGQDRKSKRL